MADFTDMMQGGERLLGFASTGVAYAYIGSILASLLCVLYGLTLWAQERGRVLVQGWKKRRPMRKGRGLGWRRRG